ncbi:MAG: hypothetical protein ACR2MN_13865 [Acidimicrobiales bacterium]
MSGPDDPLGRRSLFSRSSEAPAVTDGAASAHDGARPVEGATGESARLGEGGGRGALFSTPQVSGRSVVVTCRTCRARTPLSFPDVVRRLLPSMWVPILSPWSRWMRCPSCGAFSWCRVDWSHLISGG